jgi:uncharacterized protein
MIEIWLAFLAGLAATPHCLGMCGGIVAAMTMARNDQPRGQLLLFHLLYNCGRLLTYALLGTLAGLVGASLDLLDLRTCSLWLFAAANLFIMAVGLATLFSTSRWSLFSLEFGSGGFVIRAAQSLLHRRSVVWGVPLGMVLGFLPCGLIYGPLVVAVGSGSPWRGAATLAALGLGTMPGLLGFGWLAGQLTVAMRGAMFKAAAVAVTLMGGIGLWRILGKMGYMTPFPLW